MNLVLVLPTEANGIRTTDRRRELESLRQEADALQRNFEQIREDVRVLYSDKVLLREQHTRAHTDAVHVEQTVANYRKSASHLLA